MRTSILVSMAASIAMLAAPNAALGDACPDFPLIRYEVELSALRDPACASDPLDALRYVPLDEAPGISASVGGEIRQRYEYTHNPGFGADAQDRRGVWLQRYAVHADLHQGEHLRFFAELQGALEQGRADGPGPTDQDDLEIQNAFLEVSLAPQDDSGLRLRLGRQEIQLGSARLVSVRDGPNVRRTFDGLRLLARFRNWSLSALAVRPRRDRAGVFDDATNDDKSLWGVYATRMLGATGDAGVDLYYLGYRNPAAVYDQGGGTEIRHTLGTRMFGTRGGWDWNWEPMIQFGRFDGADLRAWTIASETGFTWTQAQLAPRLALSANIASGDRDPRHRSLETFNPLFPRGNYFSEDGTLGPYNFYNAHLFFSLHPSTRWTVTADYELFWRLSTHDGVYGPSGNLLRSGAGSDARFVATGASFNSEWSVGRHWRFTAIYTRLWPQQFMRDTGPAASIDFFELTARFRF